MPEKPDQIRDGQEQLVLTKANTLKGRPPEPKNKIPRDAKMVIGQSPTCILAEKLVQGLMLPPDQAFPYFRLFLEHAMGLRRRRG